MFKNFFDMLSLMRKDLEHKDDKIADKSEWADDSFYRSAEHLTKQRKIAIDKLGKRWLLHPCHTQRNLDVPPNSLGRKTA
jgi:hypothetical protein